ncbi:MAG: hypothetical protein KGL39_02765 [Patescibacteria group bacterium]|nr:hypothetical protein [Patescibacteria group bacterium]
MNANISLRTPFNQRPIKSTYETRRVLRNGRWVRPNPEQAAVLRWLRGEGESK